MVLTMEMRFVLTLERRIGFMYGQVRGREYKVGQLLSSKACGDRKACGWLGDGEETGADNGGYNGRQEDSLWRPSNVKCYSTGK